MEILDIVDLDDRVIGQASREEIHAQALIHRASHMILFNSSGQVFLQRRSFHKDSGGGLWDSSAAGHVDSGESYLDCAVRELAEELGLQVDADALEAEFKMSPRPETGMEFAMVYSVISDATLTLDRDEIIDGCWVEPNELSQWIQDSPGELTYAFTEIWAQLCAPNLATP